MFFTFLITWTGGVRGAAFVHSPLLESKGRVSLDLMHVTDWLPTLYALAGGSASKLRNVDGYNVWDTLSSGKSSPRQELLHNIHPSGGEAAMRYGQWKILVNAGKIKQDAVCYRIGHFWVILCLCFKRVFLQNLSYKNEFDLHENEAVGGTHFHMNGFARRLVLTRRQKATQKWPITLFVWVHVCRGPGREGPKQEMLLWCSQSESQSIKKSKDWLIDRPINQLFS